MENISKYIGKKIVEIRVEIKVTQANLAKAINITQNTLSRYERGIRDIPSAILNSISKYFDMPIYYFYPIYESLQKFEELISVYEELNTQRKQDLLLKGKTSLKMQKRESIQRIVDNIQGYVSAGEGEFIHEVSSIEPQMLDNQPFDYDYALIVRGKSMEPILENNQIIFVKRATISDARTNQIVIAVLNGKAYVKKIHFLNDRMGCELVSLNPKFKNIKVRVDDDFKIEGIVII